MKCAMCGGTDVIVALMEIFPCKFCGKEMRIEYNVCNSCAATWKSLDGQFFSDATIFDVGLGDVLNEKDICRKSKKEVVCMGDYIHKCLRCNALCYEAEEGVFVCPDCDFRWEVISG